MSKETRTAKTYDEWKALDYHVIKGQKATSWTLDGKALFEFNQVAENVHYGGWPKKWHTEYDFMSDDDAQWDVDFGYAMGVSPGSEFD